jgi:uncharacterized protein (UPF0548 family)
VLLFSSPSTADVDGFLAQARQSAYSYSEVGATSGSIPSRYTTDHNRVLLGRGPAVWNKAVAALQAWEMFNVDWIRLYWPSAPIQAGENVAVLAQYLNCYWLNACRIVYVIQDDGPLERFGFAYGTLYDHAESGEERFLLEWDHDSDEVWYDLLAFSRPNQFLARIGYPLARQLQKKFASGSKAAMIKAVSQAVGK